MLGGKETDLTFVFVEEAVASLVLQTWLWLACLDGPVLLQCHSVTESINVESRGPGLLYTKGVESKGRNEILRGKRDSVGAIAIIRRVDNEGDVIREHFVDIKDNTSISVTTERVPSNDRKRIRGGGREDFNSGRGGAG